jgi:hypothetical protein
MMMIIVVDPLARLLLDGFKPARKPRRRKRRQVVRRPVAQLTIAKAFKQIGLSPEGFCR